MRAPPVPVLMRLPLLMFVMARFVDVALARVVLPETVRPVSVPTLVSEEAVTPAAKVEPVRLPAGADPVMLPVRFPMIPAVALSTPLIVLLPVTARAEVVSADVVGAARGVVGVKPG